MQVKRVLRYGCGDEEWAAFKAAEDAKPERKVWAIEPPDLPINQQLTLLKARNTPASLICIDKLTPAGHFKANALIKLLCRKLGVHIISSGGDSWNDFVVRCSCGTWSSHHSRKEGNVQSVMARAAARHLEAVGALSDEARARLHSCLSGLNMRTP